MVVSAFLLGNMNYFGACGGFDAIATRMAETTNPLPFNVLRGLVRVVGCCNDYLVAEFAGQLVPKARMLVASCIGCVWC